jgi:hypothetical protein
MTDRWCQQRERPNIVAAVDWLTAVDQYAGIATELGSGTG